MARGVDEVQAIGFAVVGRVVQSDGGGLNGNAPLLFQLHGVQHLLGVNTLVDGVALLQQPVCQRGLAVVNVGDDGKIANFGKFGHWVHLIVISCLPCQLPFLASPARRQSYVNRRAHDVILPIIANFSQKVNCMFSRNQGKTVPEAEKHSLKMKKVPCFPLPSRKKWGIV